MMVKNQDFNGEVISLYQLNAIVQTEGHKHSVL